MEHTIDKKDTEARIVVTIPWSEIAEDFAARITAASKGVEVKGFAKVLCRVKLQRDALIVLGF